MLNYKVTGNPSRHLCVIQCDIRHVTCARVAISKIRTARGSWGRQIHTLVNTWQKEIEEKEILKIAISIFILLQSRSYIQVPCSLSFQPDDCSQDYLGPAASGVTQAY